jgi:RNA polymerase sigma-70 factor (ECF subfamily)
MRDVTHYFASLPERQREVIKCILQEEVSIRDTASKLKISEGAVRVALHRGLAMIAQNFRRDMA